MSNEFITTDSSIIYDEILSLLAAGISGPLYAGDERRIFGEALVPVFVSFYNAVNDACRQKALRHARGGVLDNLGERFGVFRLLATSATTTLRFSLKSAIDENVLIQAGTKVTSDNARYFETTTAAVIQAGQLYVDVEAVSVGGGTEYNDIPVGALNSIVDLIPYVDNVSNITTTSGGTDEETDDSLRDRIREAPSKMSTAGPYNAYRYWAISADVSIADASVTSDVETITRTLTVYGGRVFQGGGDLNAETLVVYKPDGVTPAAAETDFSATYDDDLLTIELLTGGSLSGVSTVKIEIERTNACVVRICPMCEDGVLPSEAILEKVREACNASDVRPATDKVIVEAPATMEYDIVLTYYTSPEDESACVQTVEGVGGAIDQYKQWQGSTLGRAINPDKLRALILAPKEDGAVGANRVVITSPQFSEIDRSTVAVFSGKQTIRHEVRSV